MSEVLDPRSWEAWQKVHQPFELGWWKQALAEGHSGDATFERDWAPVIQFIQPQGQVIDIGCGPRPPFVPSTVIDPLANEYRKITPASWWSGVVVHSQPAEVRVPRLYGDTIICWNCLDHTIGWLSILDNMLEYGRGNPNARFAVATDFQEPFDGHPGFDREEFMSEIFSRFQILEKREPFGRELALLMIAR